MKQNPFAPSFSSREDFVQKWLEADRQQYADPEQQKRLQGRVEELPQLFRERIYRFTANSPNFHTSWIVPELFVCEIAVILLEVASSIEALHTLYTGHPADLVMAAPKLSNYTYIPQGYGFAFGLACTAVENPRWIPYLHGYLYGPVGCIDYGCHTQDELDHGVTPPPQP